MPRKNYRWLEVKATKKIDEWRRINKIYGQRHKLRNQLRIEGAKLLDKIHNYRLIQTPGPADALIDEVRKVLRLPYAWNQEDYDHATARLKDIEVKVYKMQQQIIPKSTELSNTLLMVVMQSKEEEGVKADFFFVYVRFVAYQEILVDIQYIFICYCKTYKFS